MKYLVMTVIGVNRPECVGEVAKFITASGCSITESRWSTLGQEFVANYLLSGNWNAVAKLEAGMGNFERKHEVKVLGRRTEMMLPQPERLPYTIYLIAQDRAGILEQVTDFLAGEDVQVLDYHAYTYPGRFTKADLVSLTISVSVSANSLVSEIRERFIIFCDELNLDATMEPDKGI